MVNVSNLYKEKIYGPERSIQAKVSFEILNLEAYEDADIVVSDEAGLSRLGQTINKNRDMSHKYATFEQDYFKLDGSFYIPPTENQGDSELGWWSSVLSGEDGTYIFRPTIEFNFDNPQNSLGLTLTFDRIAEEYASDFRIQAYGANGDVLVSETITGNTSPIYYFTKALENYRRIVITIIKWAKPNRRARLVEVDFGIVMEYTGDKLISLKVIEEMDLLASTVPSNEIEFVLDNSDQSFNILNPNGIYKFLTLNQEIKAQLGLLIGEQKYEWIPMGHYFLTEWTVEEGAMTSTFVGRDIFTRLDSIEYVDLLQNTNLYDLAVDILTQAKVEKFQIDESLKEILTIGFKEKIKTRVALQMIAMAGRSIVRQDRNGTLLIEQFEELTFETGYLTFTGQEIAGFSTIPQVNIDYGFQAIDFDTAYEIPKITLSQKVTHLVFKTIQANGNKVDIKFINSAVKEGIGYEIDNPLINTEEHAAKVAEWMFREYDFIAEYQAYWRQNPSLECGTIILIEDNFDNKKKARITKQEFNYEGYLDGVTEAKGGI